MRSLAGRSAAGFKQRQDVVDVGRLAKRGRAVALDEDLGERRQDADVLVAARRDRDAQVDGLAVPVDAVGVLEEPEGGPADEGSRPASVPWGIETPSPMYVEICPSRSRIAAA